MANLESISRKTNMIENEIRHETLGNIIIEAINIIRRNKKDLYNSSITSTFMDIRLSTLTIGEKFEIKFPLGKKP